MCYISWNWSEHSFGIVESYRSRRYAWIVPQRKTHGEPSSYVKSPIRIRGAIFSMLRLQRYCEQVAADNWRRPRSFKRSSKTGMNKLKFWCQNSNLNLPTIKNGFYGYSYLKDLLRIMKRIWAQFWNHWVMPVTYVCLDSATTQNSWRTSAQRTYLVFTFGGVWTLIELAGQVDGRLVC